MNDIITEIPVGKDVRPVEYRALATEPQKGLSLAGDEGKGSDATN